MQNPALRHRLLAILAADGVGYSRLMGLDERATVAALDAARDVFSAQISAGGGRLVDTAGDSVLAVFETAGGAVGAALAVQNQLAKARGDVPAEQVLRFRIGVHLGDVFEKTDGTVYGDGVNVAARLQALAEPDGIIVSQAVHSAVQGRVAATFEDIGRQSVKNIDQPVQALRVRAGQPTFTKKRRSRTQRAAATALLVLAVAAGGVFWWAHRPAGVAADEGKSMATARKSIAVLPFASVRDGKSDDFLADAVTDELINVLSRAQGLRVAARNSSFYFKDKQVQAGEAARQLDVGWLVEGTVQRVGDRVRIGAQLVSAADGTVVWSQSFDRELNDVLKAQREIALGIAGSLKQSLDTSASLVGTGTTNAAAWLAFLDAQRLSPDKREAAYKRVLEMDPNFARVYVELADDALSTASAWGGKEPNAVVSRKAAQYLREALRINPRYAHAEGISCATTAMVDDLDGTRRHSQRALELDPKSAPGHWWKAQLARAEGNMGAALAEFKLMVEIDPLDVIPRYNYAQGLRFANRPAQALEAAEQLLALDPGHRGAGYEKAEALLMLGRREEALRLAREQRFQQILARAGTRDDLAALQRAKDLKPHVRALLQVALGRPAALVEHLEPDHSQMFPERSEVLFAAEYDPIRELPSFKAWLAKYHLTEAHDRAQAWRAANPLIKS